MPSLKSKPVVRNNARRGSLGGSYRQQAWEAKQEGVRQPPRRNASNSLESLSSAKAEFAKANESGWDIMQKFLLAVKNINAQLAPVEAADAIIKETCGLLNCDRSTLYFVDGDSRELVLVIAKGAKNIRIPIGTGIAGFVAEKGVTLNVPDAYEDNRFSQAFDKSTGYKTDSILCTPVFDINGDMVAVLQCINKNTGPFTRSDELLVEHMASHVGIVLRNARMFESERNAHSKIANLLEIVKSLHTGSVSTNSLIFTLSNKSHELVDASRCTLYLVDRSRAIPQLVVMQGEVDIRLPLTKGIAGSVATSGQALLIPDAYKDHRFSPEIDKQTGFRTKAILTMPIWGAGKRVVVGVLQVINKLDDSEFSRTDKELLETLLDVAGPILETSQIAQRKINQNTGEEVVKPTYGRQRRGSGTVKAGLLGAMRQGNKGIKPVPKGPGFGGAGQNRKAGGFKPSFAAPSGPMVAATPPKMGAFAEDEEED